MNSPFFDAYEVLQKVYRDGTYLQEEMKTVTNKRVTKLVYGVLDKHYELSFVVDSLAERGVKNALRPLLYEAIYAIKYLSTPKNVVLNEIGETLDVLGKSALKSFFSAIVNRVAGGEYPLPKKSDKHYEEVKYNMPSFLVGLYKKDYPDTYEEILSARKNERVHVRVGKNGTEEELFAADPTAERTKVGFFVKNNREISLLNFFGKVTYMSYTSALSAESIVRSATGGARTLDCCAAPGGKSVYLAERGLSVVSCDVHPHRVGLIRSYASRMGVDLSAKVADATVFCEEWADAFDVVYADVPCSGMGVIGRRKDVVFNKTYEDILALSDLQKKIVNNVSSYVRPGGLLVYSTCTVFSLENGKVVDAFLDAHPDFSLERIPLEEKNDGKIQFLPDGRKDGFFLCMMRRKS